ncbi:PepSY domain-containing protein [Acinetobacter sp. R933-2]|uniref:sulfite reductase flavoprotein subunit alpha n=1 Tax=Acinetobacter sp. R933-2 TaxID=2746728 RepID=UPI002574A264|nr:sulfite reductase flavoprotein subunit alpha [Acinetobacter sp. R933-2]MDM1246430.1 PepSY domain-containing protein [Acinetobacter sp. R933-2]
MFKKILFQLHWFFGITAGLILAIMGVTGAIYSYEQPIQKLINPDSYTVKIENRAKLTPTEIFQHFQYTQPEMKINSITIDQAPEASSSINIEKEGARKGFNIMINPYTAAVLPDIQGREFFQFIQKLHRTLTMGDLTIGDFTIKNFGKQLTGASTLILIYFILSGLYLRWPKKHSVKQWLSIKPKLKGRNFLWDLHAVVGTWVVIFYLLLALTGLYWSYDWWRSGMFKVLGVEQPKPEMQANNKTKGLNQPKQKDQHEQKSHQDRLSPAQIDLALTQTWQGLHTQLKHDYSSITLSVPKKADGLLEVSFVDPIPQHERARNKAVYDYQQHQVKKIELYANKKLNEKIMSSMLPVHRGSFFGPIYQFLVMLAALCMPLFFITGWMLYLKRRKQKQLTLAARQHTTTTTIDPNATPWLISYASQTGVSEQLAWRTATSLQAAHQPVTVKALQHLSLEDLQNSAQILFVVSTYGTGDAPDLAATFVKKFMQQSVDLKQLKYAVLALGSKEYPETYCSFGHQLDAWLQQNQAQAFFKTIEVDNANAADIERWTIALAKMSKLELNEMSIQKVFDQWTLKKRELLNPNSLGAPAYHLELQAEHPVLWQAGDIAEIQTGNSLARIQAFLDKYHISAHTSVDGSQQSIQQILCHRDLTGEIEPFANMQHLLEQLPLLPTREYSIASIPSQHVVRLVIRQQTNVQGELGLGSGWLTQHCQLGDQIAMRIRTNEAFHLIADNRPIICIGNGTGIAGLMSLIHSRVRLNYLENWLIFGERQQAHDFFFKATLQAWQTTGMLKKLDLAFSRDQEEKIYVHHKLREQQETVRTWVQQGAIIYVCGSIQGMASDVDQALIDILGEDQVNELRETGRYKRDVY